MSDYDQKIYDVNQRIKYLQRAIESSIAELVELQVKKGLEAQKNDRQGSNSLQ